MPILVSVPGYLLVPEIELELEPSFNLERSSTTTPVVFRIAGGDGHHWFCGVCGKLRPMEIELWKRLPARADCSLPWGSWDSSEMGAVGIALTFLVALLFYIGLVFSQL